MPWFVQRSSGRGLWVGISFIVVGTAKDLGHSTIMCLNRVIGTGVAMCLGVFLMHSKNLSDGELTWVLSAWFMCCALAASQLAPSMVYRYSNMNSLDEK